MADTTPTANAANPQANIGGDPNDPAPGAAPPDQGSLIGIGKDYHVPKQITTHEVGNRPDIGTRFPSGGPHIYESGHGYTYNTEASAIGTKLNPVPYRNDDEWGPLGDPKSVIPLQQALVAAGKLSPKSFVPGVWGTESAAAYRSVMAEANAGGAYVNDQLNTDVEKYQKLAKTGGSAPGPYNLANSADVRAGYQQAAEQLTGSDLPKSEAEQFAAEYQRQEQQAYHELGAAQVAGTLTSTSAPTVDTASADYIKAHHMDKVIGYGMASRMQEFFGMLKGV